MPGDQLYPRLSGEGILLCRMVKLNAVLAVDMKKFNKNNNNNNLTPRLRLLNSEIGWCDFEMVMTWIV